MSLFEELFPDVRSEEEIAKFVAEAKVRQWAPQRAYHKRERAKDPKRYRALYTKWARENPEKNRERKRKYWSNRLYGLTLEQRAEMLAAQGGKCGNLRCGATSPGGKGDWHVDHNHDTGKIGLLLCHHCNTMMGLARDNPDILRGGADYLEKHR